MSDERDTDVDDLKVDKSWDWYGEEHELEDRSRRVVQHEVYACMSGLVERMVKTDAEAAELLFQAIEDAEDCEEVYEWWVVSPWLGEKLSESGEVVVDDYWGVTLWGRQCSGQAIHADGVIRNIVRELP